MLVAIHQLHYLPWLRYVEKIARADVFIVLDDIQYNKGGWQNRNKIKAADGPLLLTVPVLAKDQQRLDEVRINNTIDWRRKHFRSIEQAYRSSPYWAEHAPFLAATYDHEWTALNDLNKHMLNYFMNALGLRTPVRYSSELEVPGIATERLSSLIRAVGGDAYYTGTYAVDSYLDMGLFENNGIQVLLQHWTPPIHPQLHGDFAPDLSILDVLLNCGPTTLDVIRTGGQS
ncbi:MAG: WbqC family protein [Candidatus Hydrogenedentota bacterium]